MRHVRQRPRSCAPACVAILAGCDLELATFAIGRDGPSTPARVRRALQRLGMELGRRRELAGKLPPRNARGLLVLVQMTASFRHVAVLDRGTVLDPALRGPVELERYPVEMARMLLATQAWFEVSRREG